MPPSREALQNSTLTREMEALHDYVPFEVPWTITTAENGTIRAYGTGTLRFTASTDGKEVTGELHSVYSIPDIHTRLVSVGKLYSQGWGTRLSRNAMGSRSMRRADSFCARH